MQIIKSHHILASQVSSWGEIKKEAKEIHELINKGNFEGLHQEAVAIAHAQVSEEPKNFFVLHESMERFFGTWCVVNLEITSVELGNTTILSYEGCMSFPDRKETYIKRCNIISVKYQVPFLGFLKTKTARLEGLPSHIVQHEFDHERGINIYGL